MKWDYEWRRRAIHRHRVVFRTSGFVVLTGVFLCILGAVCVTSRHDLSIIGLGMLLIGLAGLNAYRIVLATVKLVELDRKDGVSSLHN